jgi:hypothetical protein
LISQVNESIPKHIITNYSKEKAALLKYPEIPKKYQITFAEDNAFTKFSLIFNHGVYYNQPILEEYIRSILKRLDPSNPEVNTLNIFISKQTEFNAFTIADGSVFINIAALADMSNEAELAFLIGHEFGHYKLKHVSQGYVNSRKNGKNPSQKEQKEGSSFSQALELQADSIGYRMAFDAGYDYRAMDILMQRLLFLQKKGALLQYKEYHSEKINTSSHPISEERILSIKKLNTVSNNGLLNPSGEERFKTIQQLAEFEYLKVLDESSDLLSAISFPLKQFLLTDDKKYLPVMVRALRKVMLLVPEYKDRPFLTVHFQDFAERFKEKENIFSNLYYEYPDSNEVNKMYQNKSVNFKHINSFNFEMIFKYFADMASDAGYQEPFLDLALHYGVKTANGKRAINEYLKKENNLYYDFAQQLKENKIISSLQNGEDVVLFDGVHNYTFKKRWVYFNNEKYFNTRHESLTKLREKYTKHQLEYKIYDYLDFIQQNEIGQYLSTIENLIYSGYSSKILDYDPRVYYSLKQANIRSLEFMSISHYNVRKRLFLKPILLPLNVLFIKADPKFTMSSQHISTAYYYRIGLGETEVLGVNNGYVKTGPMTKKRAQRILYKLHKKTRKLTNS